MPQRSTPLHDGAMMATFSGWYFFDEFDALVLLTVAVLLWRQQLRRGDFRLGWPTR